MPLSMLSVFADTRHKKAGKVFPWLFLFGFALLLFVRSPLLSEAQIDTEDQGSFRAILQERLSELAESIASFETNIFELKREQKTLGREIRTLDLEIRKAELEIEQTELAIKETEKAIADIEKEIAALELKIAEEKNVLAELLRQVQATDDVTLLETMLSADVLSDFFSGIRALENLQHAIQGRISSIQTLKEKRMAEERELEKQREEQSSLKVLQEIQRAELEEQRLAKEELLTTTRGRESIFQRLLKETRGQLGLVRSQLYALESDGISMTLEEALRYATPQAEKAGIRPAFLLALLERESHWGARLGTGTWREDMHPRDREAFLTITKELGLDPDKTPVSRKPWYGWGGAMGPAQFIPTTWLAWKDRIAESTGHNPPSPWSLDDAFAGAALKLAQGGANEKTRDAEWRAAMIYFAGSNWDNPLYAFYGDSVMELAAFYEEELAKM